MRTEDNYYPVKLYQKVRFDPFSGLTLREVKDNGNDVVTGKVTYINHDKHWFLVEYITRNGLKQSISFNFSDIGQNVFKV